MINNMQYKITCALALISGSMCKAPKAINEDDDETLIIRQHEVVEFVGPYLEALTRLRRALNGGAA